MRRSIIYICCLFGVVFMGMTSCKKDIPFAKDHLDFSTDSILFDTIFTTVGSTTQSFKIYNRNNQPINIEQIILTGGSSSPYRINIDGVSGIAHYDIEIPANDSLFGFVEVTLDVNGGTLPLVVSDSVSFRTNGLDQYVYLDAWGQDAYFHVNEITDGVWPTDKPHVLYGDVAVGYPGIDSNLTLTIPGGAQIYCHKDARLLVYKSTLNINGTLGNEVIFQGDRLESFYDDISGQWWGIRLIEANSSTIDYTVIKNASVALQVDSTQDPLTLTMSNTIVQNNDFFGLNVNAGSNIQVENCLFADAGIASVYLFAGGEYHFKHCDFVNYWIGSRAGPSLAMVNWWENEGTIYSRDIISSDFYNCVAYGNVSNEWVVDTLDPGGLTIDFTVGNCLLANEEPYEYANYSSCIWNEDPLFVDPAIFDFHFEAASPLNGNGDPSNSVPTDLEGNARTDPDIGCYEL